MNKMIKKIFLYLDQEQKNQAFFLILLMTITAFTEFMGLGLILILLNKFLGITSTSGIYFIDSLLSGHNQNFNLNYILIFASIIFSLKFIIQLFVVWRENIFLSEFREKASNKLYFNLLRRDPSKLTNKNSSEYLRNFTEEISNVVLFYQSIIKITLDLIIFFTFVFFLILYNPTISILVVSFFSIFGLIYFLLVKNNLSKWSKQGLEGRKKKIQLVNESFLAIKYIKILSSENFFFDKFKNEIKSLSKIIFNMSFLNNIPRHIFEYILFLSIIFLLFFSIHQNYPNEKIMQMMGVYTLVAFRIIPIINKVLTSSQHIKFTSLSFRKLFSEQNQPIISKKPNYKSFLFRKKIDLKIKKFNYEKKKKLILKNINLKIKKYSKVGIIGASGSGKSTIIDILCGFINNKEVTVRVDGQNIFDNLEGWQSKIGYIPQDVVILNETLRENILFGSESHKFSDKKILNIIKNVKLDKFLEKLPNGLSHTIKQNGMNISGGEKQRVGIARALLHDPDIILLDEATSGLDSFTESRVLDTIKNLNKTIIIVSHRLNTLKFCDKVYIIKNNIMKLTNIS
jgi:ATP-binding cassette, subfamily B, bacterial PglK